MIYITAVRLNGGAEHVHITDVMWVDGTSGKSDKTTTDGMIKFIDTPHPVQVAGPSGPTTVAVVRPDGQEPYLRTHADSQWTDNLLALPRF